MIYPAHIRQDGSIQTVTEHCKGTADIAKEFGENLGLPFTFYLAGILHDAGKCSKEFSEYIQKAANGEHVQRGSVVHSFAAVRYLLNTFHKSNTPMELLTSELLSVAIGSHHGLFDCFDKNGNCGFSYRVNMQPQYDDKAIQSFFDNIATKTEIQILFEKSQKEIQAIFQELKRCSTNHSETLFELSILSRLLTSALIDADRTDTADFMNNKDKAFKTNLTNQELLEGCLKHFNDYISGFQSDTPVKKARRELSELCCSSADMPSGIYRLNLPTGGGKTLSGLRYALNHALVHGKERIFFISPLLSILEQNAEAIRKAVGNDSIILEHHSDVLMDNRSEDELYHYDYLCDTWNSPIVITTLVQFLNTLFSEKTSSVRRFHSLANSVIVIDEVQTVPVRMLALFNSAINFLSTICNTTVILCSATQPEFGEIKPPLLRPNDIISGKDLQQYNSVFKRNQITYMGARPLAEIPELITTLLLKYNSVLVICNKKSQASELYGREEFSNIQKYHLSAGMCIAHRKQTLGDIKHNLALGIKTLCVSTQVIEAGVDISFDAVIRLSAGLDSIVQAAGRCNRNGDNAPDAPVWVVECSDENIAILPDIHDGKKATESLIDAYTNHPEAYNYNLASEEAVSFYYRKLYREKSEGFFEDIVGNNPSIYSLHIQEERYHGADSEKYIFQAALKTAGELFQVFDTEQKSVIVPWKDGESVIAQIFSEGNYVSKETLDLAKPYTVSVFDNQFIALQKCGAITTVCNGTICILDKDFYDDNTGIINEKKGETLCNTLIL